MITEYFCNRSHFCDICMSWKVVLLLVYCSCCIHSSHGAAVMTSRNDTSLTGVGVGGDGEMLDYCEGQSFTASCRHQDEVVLIKSAYYGRMRLGRCLGVNYGNVGCQLDVTSYFDVWCSGQRSCDIRVSSIIDSLPENTFPCTRDFRGFLEASYVCVKVVSRSREDCASSSLVQVPIETGPGGYLASVVTDETGCGSLDTPWLLRTSPGQTIRLRLLDFESASRSTAGSSGDTAPHSARPVCQVYAVIKEKSASRTGETVCASTQRDSLVYTSLSNAVEIRVVAARKNHKSSFFLIKYEVSGCADVLLTGDNSPHWVRRNNHVAVFGCNGTNDAWELKCEGDRWVGTLRNCSPVAVAGQMFDFNAGIWNIFTGSQWAALFIVLAIALALGMIIFFIGLLYIRRKRSRQLARASRGTFGSSPVCGVGLPDYHLTHCPEHGLLAGHQLPPSGLPGFSSSKQVCGPGSLTTSPSSIDPTTYAACPTENDYFQTWQLQRHALSCTRPRPTGLGAIPSAGPPRGGTPRSVPAVPHSTTVASDPSSPTRPVVEHIYESPKFERRDFVPAAQECTCCGAQTVLIGPAGLQGPSSAVAGIQRAGNSGQQQQTTACFHGEPLDQSVNGNVASVASARI